MAQIRKILLLLNFSRTCEREFLRGVIRYGNLHGPWEFSRKLQFYLGSSRREINIRQIKSFNPDGIILSDVENFDDILSLNKPTIIHTFKRDGYNMPTVVGDTQQAGKMAAEHLLEQGFSRFAYCGLGDYYWSTGRCQSFTESIQQAGFKNDYYELNPDHIKKHPYEELKLLARWLDSLDKPVGLMTCADDCSQYVIEACKIAGINVPDQIGIIGVDNDDMVCGLSYPPLSSIALNFEKAGYDTAELLDKLMSGEQTEKTSITVSPSHIEVRASTDILAVDDPDVISALKFIRASSNELVQTADVLNEVTCCQRILHQKFMQYLGHSVYQEIKRVRVKKIAQMLRETDLSIVQIAAELGYPNAYHISRYFQQAKGITPKDYRKRFGLKY